MKEIKGENMLNTKEQDIKMRVTEEQSKQVQEICFRLGIYWTRNGKTEFNISANYLYITSSRLQWGKYQDCFELADEKEVSAEEFIKTKGFTENITEEIKQENIPKNNFKEFGFEADFEGEILKEIYDHNNKKYYIGYSIDVRKEISFPYPKTWTEDGKCWNDDDINMEDFDLTHIKKPWYETPNQFKVMMLKEDLGWYPNIFYSEDYLKAGINEMKVTEGKEWRYASKEEIYSLYQGEGGENNE